MYPVTHTHTCTQMQQNVLTYDAHSKNAYVQYARSLIIVNQKLCLIGLVTFQEIVCNSIAARNFAIFICSTQSFSIKENKLFQQYR